MSEVEKRLLDGLQDLQSDMTDIKITMARNTESLEHHVKRTDTLQDMVEPLYRRFIEENAIEAYKKKQQEERKEWREALKYKLKLPGYIVGFLAALGTLLAWLGRK